MVHLWNNENVSKRDGFHNQFENAIIINFKGAKAFFFYHNDHVTNKNIFLKQHAFTYTNLLHKLCTNETQSQSVRQPQLALFCLQAVYIEILPAEMCFCNIKLSEIFC